METIIELLLEYSGHITAFVFGLGAIAPFVLKGKKLLKEAGELLVKISDALEDNKITKEEIHEIIKEAKDLILIFKAKK